MENIYEKLGAFYMGKTYDIDQSKLQDDLILYDSKDLNTHAVIIGMTGSGKTGLGIGLIEEALIDNIPVIAIDPKGDLPNLLLSFPNLQPGDFLPWINKQDALNEGVKPEQYAKKIASVWRKGLESWDQQPERIQRFKDSAEFAVYTPGSTTGRQVNVLRNFAPPSGGVMDDPDLLKDKIQNTVTILLTLLGIDADPITSPEHILLSNIFETSWAEGKTLDLAALIQLIQKPPFQRIGVMDLDTVFPARERLSLAMRLNNLLAAPGFESWLYGDPLDISKMLYADSGKPRASIFTISHLSGEEQMFFVSMLLNEIVSWMRTQPGTSSLRALVYMDEIFGFFPPVKNPPSKKPLLTLLKQARAFGVGVVLSTQNPVDLDYKGLSNTGTWFIGRLQTERDKARVLEGLEGVATSEQFDRNRMEKILSGLGKRIFLLHNVHETEPAIFQTRWVLSYLSGPMTREQIKALTADSIAQAVEPVSVQQLPRSQPVSTTVIQKEIKTPIMPPDIKTFFIDASGAGHGQIFFPTILGRMDVHYSSVKYNINTVQNVMIATELQSGPIPLDWDSAFDIAFDPDDFRTDPIEGAEYAELPAVGQKPNMHDKWNRDLKRWIVQNRPMQLFNSKTYKLTSEMGETEGEFRARLAHTAREKRDLEVEKLRRKYSSKFNTLQDRLMRAEQAISREQAQAKTQKVQTFISFGTAILGSLLGRKKVSSSSASRFGTAMKSASRMKKEKMDVNRARSTAARTRAQLENLEMQLQDDIQNVEFKYDPTMEDLRTVTVKTKSNAITMELFGLTWMPYRKDVDGSLSADWK